MCVHHAYPLQAALVTSDHIVTVSQAYAWEIALGAQGMGLASLLQQRMADLTGIVNGIDTREWDPRTDPYLAKNYSTGGYEETSSHLIAFVFFILHNFATSLQRVDQEDDIHRSGHIS